MSVPEHLQAQLAGLADSIAQAQGISVVEAQVMVQTEVARLGALYEAGALTMVEVQRTSKFLHGLANMGQEQAHE